MRVLHVIWDLGQGGAQRYLLDLLRIHHEKISCHALILSAPGPLSHDVEQVCDKVTYINMKDGKDLPALFRIVRYLGANDYDLIHSHSNNILFNIGLHFQASPVLYTEHGGRLVGNMRQSKWIYKWLNRPINRFVAISGYMQNVMSEINPSINNRIVVIYNGVDTEGIANIQACDSVNERAETGGRALVVGFVGRFVHQKGVEYFINTAAKIINKGGVANVLFVMAGDGPLLEASKSRAKSLGITEKVAFLGYKKNIYSILKSFDILLFTSRYEPFGLVLTEAMAASVPVVAMDQEGAVSEIIRDEIDGVVIKGANETMASERVIELLKDVEKRRFLAGNALLRVRQEFSMEKNAERVLQEYESLVGEN